MDQERNAVNEILMDLDSFRRWAASNPKFKAIPDGLVLQQITEEEWTAERRLTMPYHPNRTE